MFFDKEKGASYVSRMPARNQPINTSASREAAASVANSFNSAEYLQSAFFEPTHPDLLHTEQLASGGKVTVMVPTSPYTEASVMVVGAGPQTFENATVNTEVIYNYPEDVQALYWQRILFCLDTFSCDHADGTSSHAIAAENCIAQRTNEKVRTSRTIALPHTHILCIDEPSLHKEDWSIPHLSFEQRVLKNDRLMPLFLEELKKRSPMADLAVRTFVPFGYSFTVWRGNEVASREDAVTHRLAQHHLAYAQAAKASERLLSTRNQARVIPQPSYRLYLSAQDNMVRAIVSPEFVSPAGAMEAAGIRLERSTEYPQRTSQEKRTELYQSLKAQLHEQSTPRFLVAGTR